MFKLQKLYAVMCVMICSLILTGCWPFGSAQENKNPKLVVINVLEKPEFQDCHIAGSINIPFDEFEDTIASLNKQNHYVIYCADYMCMSSGFCAKLLKNAKFEHVWAYEGGMAQWYQKGYPYQGPAQLDYLALESEDMSDDQHSDVPTISAEQLLAKMKEFGLQS
jgi:rhodanese-related sulfurtransferase